MIRSSAEQVNLVVLNGHLMIKPFVQFILATNTLSRVA